MSGGVFSKVARPRRPGAYINWEAIQQHVIAPNVGRIVAIPFTHDWGPLKQTVLLNSLGDFKAIFGQSEDTPGFLAVKQAFLGEGVQGWGGAGAVLAYRMGGSAVASAAKTLQNTSPANALTLTAKYPGTRGNDLRVTVQDHATDSSKDELILLDGTTILETYVYTDTDITGLAAQINLISGWVTASGVTSGVKLTYVSGSAFTTGNDGATLTSGDWTDAMTKVGLEQFGVFVPFDLTDSPTVSSLKTWAVNLNAKGKRFFTVVGGALHEVVADAVSRAQTLNDPNFVTIGVGSVSDANYLDVNGNPTVLSPSQLAPRIAGIIASRGEAHAITFARLQGISILEGPTDAEIEQAFDGGVVVLARDSNAESPVRIEKGLTTYTTMSNPQVPYVIFRNPKFLATMHGVDTEFQEWAVDNVVGKLPVNDGTRAAAINEVSARLKAREVSEVIQPGWNVSVDPDPAPSDSDEFIALAIALRFERSVEQVYFTIRVG